jgi:predicted aspartyl protease
MGFVWTNALIGKDAANTREIRFLVDSGSFYTVLPPALVDELELATTFTVPAIVADSRVLRLPLGAAYLRIEDREAGVMIGSLNVPQPLLGVSALEALGYKIDPVNERLAQTRPFGPAIL